MKAGEQYYEIQVTLGVVEDGDQFTGYCKELGTASCGNTYEEAEKNIRDAVQVDLKGLIEVGTLEEFLKERGVKIRKITPPKKHKKLEAKTTKATMGLKLSFCA